MNPSQRSRPDYLTRPTIAETLRDGANRLAAANIDNPRLESRLLLAHVLGRTSEDLIRDLTAETPPSAFDSVIARRTAHEPLALIIGWKEFWSLRFRVSSATLIPRPDSETLVEAALAVCPSPARVLDLGTGTGCLLLSVLRERPNAFGVGIDLSPAAARLAAGNAESLGLADRAAFLCGDWTHALSARFDLVLSNPPYIPGGDLAGLMPEVARFEPVTALDGGESGLTAYRAIVSALPALLNPAGVAVLELGIGQRDAVAALARAAGMAVESKNDLAGIPRALILRSDP